MVADWLSLTVTFSKTAIISDSDEHRSHKSDTIFEPPLLALFKQRWITD